jgi:hypothetical protein
LLRDGFHGFEPVGTFGGNFEVRMSGNEFTQDLACELFVIYEHSANFGFWFAGHAG